MFDRSVPVVTILLLSVLVSSMLVSNAASIVA